MSSNERTEPATPKKIRDARSKGQVARSRDLTAAMVVVLAASVMWILGPSMKRALAELVVSGINAAATPSPDALVQTMQTQATAALTILMPLLAVVVLGAGVVCYVQVGGLFAPRAIVPQWERVDPSRGSKNLFSVRQYVELVKFIVKVGVLVLVVTPLFDDAVRGIGVLSTRGASTALDAIGQLAGSVLLRVGCVFVLLGVLDLFFQRWQYMRDQRMTKDEVSREHKETDGDPQIKQSRDRLYREMVNQATLHEVRSADVLVVNPTHYAVALKYDQASGDDRAPEVRAKGQDGLARRMISAAEEAGVPVVRDIPLARALYLLEEGQEIPEELYEAVAIVLHSVWEGETAADADEDKASA